MLEAYLSFNGALGLKNCRFIWSLLAMMVIVCWRISSAADPSTEEIKPTRPLNLHSILDSIFHDETALKPMKKPDRININPVEIDGLIINQTRSRSGLYFYNYFFTLWNQPDWIQGYTITISEKLSSNNRNTLALSVNDVTVSMFFLKTRQIDIESQATSQIDEVLEYLYSLRLKEQLLAEELEASGI